MITITLTKKEAQYLIKLLKTKVDAQAESLLTKLEPENA